MRGPFIISAALIVAALVAVSPAESARRVPVQSILEGCCHREAVEITGNITRFESSPAGAGFYYLTDDLGSPIMIQADRDSDLRLGMRVTVSGIVNKDDLHGYYIAERKGGGFGLDRPSLLWAAGAILGLMILAGTTFYLLRSGRGRKTGHGKTMVQPVDKRSATKKEASAKPAKPWCEPPVYSRAQLKVLDGMDPGGGFELASPFVTIGREKDNDIVLPDDRVSGHHARVEVEGGHFYIIDLGSTNGTWLNGERISNRAPLGEGVRLRMGRIELVFEGKT